MHCCHRSLQICRKPVQDERLNYSVLAHHYFTKEALALFMASTNSPTWGFGRGTENLQGIWLWRLVEFDYRTSTGLGKQTLGGHKENLPCTRTQGKGALTPTRDGARFDCECPEVSGGSVSQQWPATGSEALTTAVLGAMMCWHKSILRRSPLQPLLIP